MSAVHDLRRAVRDLGGENLLTISHYDHEREGRVIELTVFFPGTTGYDHAMSAVGVAEEDRT